MRFRPRSHPYAALAALPAAERDDGPARPEVPAAADGVGGVVSRRTLPHCRRCCCSGAEPAAMDDTEQNGGGGGGKSKSKISAEEERDDGPSGGGGARRRSGDPFALLLPPSHPCNAGRTRTGRGTGNPRPADANANANQLSASTSPADRDRDRDQERSRQMERLLASTGRYLRWPLCPFHEVRKEDWDGLREEVGRRLRLLPLDHDDDESSDGGDDDEEEEIEEIEEIEEEEEIVANGNDASEGEGADDSNNSNSNSGRSKRGQMINGAPGRRRRARPLPGGDGGGGGGGRFGGGGGTCTIQPLWMRLAASANYNDSDDHSHNHSHSAMWDGGVYPDVVPGTSFARTMDGLMRAHRRRGEGERKDDDDDDDDDDERKDDDDDDDDERNDDGTGTGTGAGNNGDDPMAAVFGVAGSKRRRQRGGDGPTHRRRPTATATATATATTAMTMAIEEPSGLLQIRQDPDLPVVPVAGAEEGGTAAEDAAPSPRLLPVLPSVQRLASSSGGWGPTSTRASASTSNDDDEEEEEEEVEVDDGEEEGAHGPALEGASTSTACTSPTSICWECDESAAARAAAAEPGLKPTLSLAPSQIITVDDRIEEYDADLCRNSAVDEDANNIGGDDDGADAAAASTAACFSEEWLRRSKRKWKMQRAIRESNRIVEEQRLLPLKKAGVASASLPSPSRLDDRMRIDAALPTKDCPPTGHLEAQTNAAKLDQDVIEHLKDNFAPSSFLASEDIAQYKDEIEQDKKQDPRDRLLDMVSSTEGGKGVTLTARPPCTLISQIGNKGNDAERTNPAIANVSQEDCPYLPTLIRKDPPLPATEDRQQPPQISLPSAMSTIKSVLPTRAQMPSMKTIRNKEDDDDMDEQPSRFLEDIVSTARAIDRRSVGQIMRGSHSYDQGGIMIPQRPFPSAAASSSLETEAMEAQKSTAKEDADLAASVRSFLSKTRETDRFVAGSSLSMKANDYECRSWFVDADNPLPDAGENQPLDPDEVRIIFQDRAWCRNREEGAREMVLTGAKMKRERGCCTYRGFLTNIAVNQRYFAARYLAMVQYNTSLKQASGENACASDADEGNDLAAVPSFLVPPSISPMISDDAPCTASEAAVRIFHRSLTRTNMENMIDRNETGRIHSEPQTLLLRNRRHPNMADSARRSIKLSSLGLSAGSSNSRTRTFINSRKRAVDDSNGGGISFHDVFVVKQRKGSAFLLSSTDGPSISSMPSTALSTLGSIGELGKESVNIRGELSHLQNRAAEVAKEEEAYWKEMSFVGGGHRADTASRLTFSPKPLATDLPAASNRSASAKSSTVGTVQVESGNTVLKSSTNVKDRVQQSAAHSAPEEGTSTKRPAETKAERRERKKQKKERKREKKARKRERKERRRREKENAVDSQPEVEPLDAGPRIPIASSGAAYSNTLSRVAKTTKSDTIEQSPPPNPSSATLMSAASNLPQVTSTSAAKDSVYAPHAGPAPSVPPPLWSNAIAAMNLGFTPKPPSASRLPRPPSTRAAVPFGTESGGRTDVGSAGSHVSKGGSVDSRVLDYSQPFVGRNGRSGCSTAAAPNNEVDALAQPRAQAIDQPIRALVSEAFFESFGEVVADLSTGQYARGFYEEPEQGIASMELAGDGWGNVHTLGTSRNRKSVPTAEVRSVLLYDSPLLDGQQVDIELPGRAAVVAIRLSSWSSSTPVQGGPPQEAKNFIRRLVNVAALGRYETIHVVLCVDVDPSPSLLSGICLLQNAMSIDGVKTTYHHLTNKTIAPAIANLALEAHDRHGGEMSDTKFIEDVSSNEPLLERVRFLLSICSSLSAIQAFELARSPRPLVHILMDIVGGQEGGGPSSFQMRKVMTASLNGE